jgi:hypothetical protein
MSIIKSGIVLNTQLYEARLFENGALVNSALDALDGDVLKLPINGQVNAASMREPQYLGLQGRENGVRQPRRTTLRMVEESM